MPRKPTEHEDEYFAGLEFEQERKVLDERQVRTAETQREHTLSVVRGRCPKCGAEPIPVPYRGIELDKCARCQGVWLDFGELDPDLQLTSVDAATRQGGGRG